MGGFSTHALEAIFHYSTIIAFVCGGIGLTAALVSAFAGYQVADILQADANKRISDADVKIAVATERATALEAKTEETHLELERQKEKTAKAELDLLRLQQHLKPRRVSDAQRWLLVKRLKDAPKVEVEMFCAINGGEDSIAYAEAIRSVLLEAGWSVREVVTAAYAPIPVGIELVQRNRGPAISAAKALADGFGAAGIIVTPLFDTSQQLPDSMIRIFVGTKPLPN